MAIADNLIAHWKLNESSSPNADSHGSNDLTWSGTVGSTPGKIDDAIRFNAAGEKASIADNADLSMGDIDCSFLLWVYFDTASDGVISTFLAKAPSSGNREYFIRKDADNTCRFVVFGPSSAELVQSTVTLVKETWYFVQAYHDAAADELGIRIDQAEAWQTASHSDGIKDSTNAFTLGSTSNSAQQWFGNIDSASVWKRKLTDAEFDHMYNSGSGRDYPFPEIAEAAVGVDGDLRGGGEPKIFQQPYIIVP
jgi:hypothetical protein